LAISHCTPDCDLLYADTPFLELKKVHLDGSFEDVRHCNRLKIAWAGDFVLEITTFRSGPTKDFYSVANHLFTDICTGRTAALVLHSNEITIDPELVRWANLTYLRIARISYETLCKLVSRLPNLTDFQTYRLGFDSLPINDAFENKSLFCSPDPLMPWGAKLAAISIIQLSEGSPVAVAVRSIWTLILHAAALRELALPDEVEPHVNPFIDANVGRYPHLAYIFILPTLVMENITEYLEGRPRNTFYPNIDDYSMFKAMLVPLVFVSKYWRIAALALIYDNSALRYDSYCNTVNVCFPAWHSLKTLIIRLSRQDNWLNLLDGGTRVVAIYNSLATLRLQIDTYSGIKFLEKLAGLEIFSSLSELIITGDYPFVDDLLFRSNEKSMQTLCLLFVAIVKNELGVHDVLGRSGVGQMSRICIDKASKRCGAYWDQKEVESFRLQVHSILDMVVTLEIWDSTVKYHILGAIVCAPSTAILKRWEIGNQELDAAHIVQIVSALPCLATLACNICKAGAVNTVILAPEPLSGHCEYHGLLKNSFRKLCVSYTTSISASRMADVVVAVTTVCPSLQHVDMASKLRKEFSRHIARTSPPHFGSIGRLFYPE
ncbi:hypothetical protein GGI20_005900, partial [Coemansia sp. BCRC 34301]